MYTLVQHMRTGERYVVWVQRDTMTEAIGPLAQDALVAIAQARLFRSDSDLAVEITADATRLYRIVTGIAADAWFDGCSDDARMQVAVFVGDWCSVAGMTGADQDWLSHGSWDGTETVAGISREWVDLEMHALADLVA